MSDSKFNDINLEFKDITRFVNQIEKQFGTYLFNKYVKTQLTKDYKIKYNEIKKLKHNNLNNIECEDVKCVDEEDDDIECEEDVYINNNIRKEYIKYNKSFYYTKPGLIMQIDLIKKDINDIKKANMLYFKYPELEKKQQKTDYGFPDKYRCNYIRLKNHKIQRCKNKISEEDVNDLMCLLHINTENTYKDKYYKMYNKYK